MKKNKKISPSTSVDIIFKKSCTFLNKPRMPNDEENVTIYQAELLKQRKLIEEY